MNRRAFLHAAQRLLQGGSVVGATCLADAYFYERHQLVTETHLLPVRGAGAGWRGARIVQLSDLHLEPFTTEADIANAVHTANALQPDLILITGDFITKEHVHAEKLGEILSDLHAPLGVYGCLGNHDHWHDPDFVQRQMERHGIGILRNESTVLKRQDQSLCLAGLESAWGGSPNLRHALRDRTSDTPVLLMMHEPDFILQSSRDPRVAVQLSGHSHGGQVRIPGFSPPVRPSLSNLYPTGAHEVGAAHLYVNRGIGCIGLPLRFASIPEVTLHVVA